MVWHVPNGGHRNAREGGELKKDGVLAGVPDLEVASPGNRTFRIEVKKPDGTLSPEQIAIHKRLKQNGHEVYVMRSLQEALEFIEREKPKTVPDRG